MSIVKFTFDQNQDQYPEGAYCNISGAFPDGQVLALWEEHVGYCLADREINGYDDSDFIMTVWDPIEKRAYDINYATTRAWCYPSFGSRVDATDEVIAEYKGYRVRNAEIGRLRRRKQGVQRRHAAVKELVKVAKASGLSYNEVKKLKVAYKDETVLQACFKLLTSKLRSKFRISLRDQMIDWMKGNRGDYPQPFSPKQVYFLV